MWEIKSSNTFSKLQEKPSRAYFIIMFEKIVLMRCQSKKWHYYQQAFGAIPGSQRYTIRTLQLASEELFSCSLPSPSQPEERKPEDSSFSWKLNPPHSSNLSSWTKTSIDSWSAQYWQFFVHRIFGWTFNCRYYNQQPHRTADLVLPLSHHWSNLYWDWTSKTRFFRVYFG